MSTEPLIDPVGFECPTCASAAGVRCMTPGREILPTSHSARVQLAQAAAFAEQPTEEVVARDRAADCVEVTEARPVPSLPPLKPTAIRPGADLASEALDYGRALIGDEEGAYHFTIGYLAGVIDERTKR